MTTILSRQVSAYHDSVMDASQNAVECWDLYRPIQEAILMAPGVAASISAVLGHPDENEPNDRQESIEMLNSMLKSMTWLMSSTKPLQDHNFEVAGLPEFRTAMTQLRFMLAELLETGQCITDDSKISTASQEAFEARAQELPPPQSWYEEDFKRLRGPMAE